MCSIIVHMAGWLPQLEGLFTDWRKNASSVHSWMACGRSCLCSYTCSVAMACLVSPSKYALTAWNRSALSKTNCSSMSNSSSSTSLPLGPFARD